MSLVSSLVGGMGARREAKGAKKQARKREQAALGELSPEGMQKLMQLFYSHFWSQLQPQMQYAKQSIANNAARRGLSGAGLTQQLKAGVPGQFAQGALGQAFHSALPVASQRAGTIMQRPITVAPSWLSSAGKGMKEDEDTFTQLVSSFLGGGGGSAIGGAMI